MNIVLLTNEVPPHIYGGAGVHVEHLASEPAALEGGRHSVRVLAFGDQREQRANLTVTGMATDFAPTFRIPATAAASIIWIPRFLPVDQLVDLYSHASVFVCPSVYEPFGIINLEAMACETPVVGTAVGGSPSSSPVTWQAR